MPPTFRSLPIAYLPRPSAFLTTWSMTMVAMPARQNGLTQTPVQSLHVGALVVVEAGEAVGACGGVDDDEVGVDLDEVGDCVGGRLGVGFDVVDVAEVVVGCAHVAEAVAGVVLAHFEVDEDGGAAFVDDAEDGGVGGECFRGLLGAGEGVAFAGVGEADAAECRAGLGPLAEEGEVPRLPGVGRVVLCVGLVGELGELAESEPGGEVVGRVFAGAGSAIVVSMPGLEELGGDVAGVFASGWIVVGDDDDPAGPGELFGVLVVPLAGAPGLQVATAPACSTAWTSFSPSQT